MYLDEKITVWIRNFYDDSYSKEQILESLKDDYDLLNNNAIYPDRVEILEETTETLSLEDNKGESTLELYHNNGKISWENGKRH